MATWGELEKAGTKWRDLEEMTWGELEEFCVINPKTKQIPDDMEVSFVPMQSVSDTGAVQTDEVRKASEVKKGFTFFEEGDVLFAKITPCMENGKGGIARGLKNGVGFGSTEFHVLHPAPEKVSSEWLYYLTSWDEFRKQCARNMTGSAGQKRVPKSYLEHYKVHLPPLEAQRRIAEVLDKVSGLISKRREQLDKLDELVKARFVEMFGDLKSNPHGWDTFLFGEYFDITSSKRILKSEWKSKGIPFLRVRDMVQLASTGKIDNEFFVSEKFYASLSDSDGVPKQGDILVSATSTLGKCHVVNAGERFYFKDADVLRFRATKAINPVFFMEQMKTDYIKGQIDRTLGITTVPHFTIKAAKTISMRCPDINRQNEFATFVTQTNKSKLTIQQSLDKLEVLKKALMQQYFG